MDQWEIGKSTGVCAVTGRELAEGEEFHAVLFEDGESFRRADYSLDAWDGPPPGAFCHFKTRIPVQQEKKRLLVDDDLLVEFFRRLADETEPARRQFRFVLALILMRKRILRYEGTEHQDNAEYWQMTLTGRRTDGRQHRVLNPHLADEQIDVVSQQLGAILHGDVGIDDDTAAQGDQADPPHLTMQPAEEAQKDDVPNA